MRCAIRSKALLSESSLFLSSQGPIPLFSCSNLPSNFFKASKTFPSLEAPWALHGISKPVLRAFSTSESEIQEQQSASKNYKPEDIRNVAIIAHVDHGKTTLVDALLRQSGYHIGSERAMDSNDLEQEKGITILSKCTSIAYKNNRINIVDTPGHQDFGGEVERIMNIVDGVLLLVCASDGPMVHTKYVLKKALEHGVKPIVVINKVDRQTARTPEVESEVFKLLEELNCSEEDILNLKFFYASGREGWAVEDVQDIPNALKADKSEGLPNGGVTSILDAIIREIPKPKVGKVDEPSQMLVTGTESHKFFGKLLFGRLQRGSILVGSMLTAVNREGKLSENGKILKILKRQSMNYYEIPKAIAGDIVLLAGFTNATVGDTLNDPSKTDVVSSPEISPPIVSVTFHVNNSPIQGKEGSKITAQLIRERLVQEAENDVALKVIPSKAEPVVQVQGRGDLHLGVLVEKMRREGFEFQVSPPEVLYKINEKGTRLEPIETVFIEVDDIHVSLIMEKVTSRCGKLIDCITLKGTNRQKIHAEIPTRGLSGLRTEIQGETSGSGVIEKWFKGYEPYKGPMKKRGAGAIISTSDGKVTAYGMKDLEKFGRFFIKPGNEIYRGMVIGESTKGTQDVEVNPTKAKKFTNIRTHAVDEAIRLTPPKEFSIEELISYVRGMHS